jgi:hypothetical protein
MSELEEVSSRALIQRAESSGTLSKISSAALQKPEVVREIDAALEDSYTLESPANVLLLTMMPDDSGSIESHNNKEPIMLGHNELLAEMRKSDEVDRTLLQTRYLNGTVLNPFAPLSECRNLAIDNYLCNHGTPLLQQTLVTLGTVMAKTQELLDLGARVRTATLIMTDAESTEANAARLKLEVASVVHDMGQIGDHIVAGMGFATGGSEQYFRKVFADMGIPTSHVFTAASRAGILDAFRMFRRSVLALTAGGSSEDRVFEL